VPRMRPMCIRPKIGEPNSGQRSGIHDVPFLDEPRVNMRIGQLEQRLAEKRNHAIAQRRNAHRTHVSHQHRRPQRPARIASIHRGRSERTEKDVGRMKHLEERLGNRRRRLPINHQDHGRYARQRAAESKGNVMSQFVNNPSKHWKKLPYGFGG
jgi:hypothetical protein